MDKEQIEVLSELSKSIYENFKDFVESVNNSLKPIVDSLKDIYQRLYKNDCSEYCSEYIDSFKFYDHIKKLKSQVIDNKLKYVRCRNDL